MCLIGRFIYLKFVRLIFARVSRGCLKIDPKFVRFCFTCALSHLSQKRKAGEQEEKLFSGYWVNLETHLKVIRQPRLLDSTGCGGDVSPYRRCPRHHWLFDPGTRQIRGW